MSGVKGARSARAAETRRRILAAATELFLAGGYGATTLQQVADRAGVAVQTIYFTFRNKPALLKELVDVAIAGDDGPLATMERPWFARATDAPDARSALNALVTGSRAVLERVAAVAEMVRIATAAHPELRDLWPDHEDPRHTVHTAAAKALAGKPGAATGLDVGRAADVLYALLSPELFLILTRDRAWPPEVWERWAEDTLAAQLLTPGA
ncbi:TetR/AcrR family transcriptional regulator [Amycolatopsis rubida]|uniref:TetR/AcrR family transcriptional regulator n=1 Tax=Amycolatopsis rubida TaxID=112413 RepID=A0ABX0BZ49_9PSEU|nr:MULTISPECIES: TetR/AcrR family transcriptional regulator [Amycolatopsis]MYW94908.1 TetR family transcriptional regulator [Amycolatopsis rubida]MYW95872.1 TetR family transcriptional regulator [Amycolatopsis rubida]NEC59895.1 TetR/AcrR family transcriptional regulator [Amycolatopsis rubida]NEC60862.1 TetR/AcrR family transcriptional regulator [Amycolatopsis rubida]OAP26667.1 putative HTH-type transcriptional regulator TtgW [Amycolatopsis sp. M39]